MEPDFLKSQKTNIQGQKETPGGRTSSGSTCCSTQECGIGHAPVPDNTPGKGPSGSRFQPVTGLEPGEPAVVVRIEGNRRIVGRLTDLGLTAGTKVRLIRKIPLEGPVEISVRDTRLALDRTVAGMICVRTTGALSS
jgi:Fe2+ transport system protein FeoA